MAVPSSKDAPTDAFSVGLGTHWLSGMVSRFPGIWSRLGDLESWVLREQLQDISIESPVHVTGLARAGTTILLEVLASHPDVGTHRYRDFPALFTPYWWSQGATRSTGEAKERAHGDGLEVTLDSPEAMEEMLWMAFHDHLHDSSYSQVLDSEHQNPAFERTYRDHIRKLLLARGCRRYVAKGNYNLTRIGYLSELFPDARFIVPVRHPVSHIASLIKQHRRFCEGERQHPRALAHMQRVGHFEFGLDRRPIHVGDDAAIHAIQSDWASGEEVSGWARYWAMLYGWLDEQLASRPDWSDRVQRIRYEDLCGQPERTLRAALEHAGLSDDSVVRQWVGRIQAPSYYQVEFSKSERRIIAELTGSVARRYGYEPEL